MDAKTRAKHAAARQRIAEERERRGLPAEQAPARPHPVLTHGGGVVERCGTEDAEWATRSLSALVAALPEPPAGVDLAGCPPELRDSFEAPTDAERSNREARARRDRRAARLRSLRLPVTAADEARLVAGELDETPVLRAVQQWAAGDTPWLLLIGTVGRGKTLAAGAWLLEQYAGRYVTAREVARVFSARYGDEVHVQQQLRDEARLVIDDLGREGDSETDVGLMTSALLDLVDYRRRSGLRTIAIANGGRGALLQRYADERLQSRLNEPGAVQWVADSGPDLRRGRR